MKAEKIKGVIQTLEFIQANGGSAARLESFDRFAPHMIEHLKEVLKSETPLEEVVEKLLKLSNDVTIIADKIVDGESEEFPVVPGLTLSTPTEPEILS